MQVRSPALPFPVLSSLICQSCWLGHRKSPPRRTLSPCSWSWLLVLLGPALPCLLASPHLVWAAAPCRRQQDLSKGLGAVRRGEPWIASWPPIPAPGAGAACCPCPPQVCGSGLRIWRGAPWGWGWLGSCIFPGSWLCSPTAVIRIGNLSPSRAADSSRVPFVSCKGFCSCSEFCVLQLIEKIFCTSFLLSHAWLYKYMLCRTLGTLLPSEFKVVFQYNVLVVKWWLTSICCGCTKAVAVCTFTWWYKVLVSSSWIV